MGTLRSAWKEAAWVFGLSRLLLLLITYVGGVLLRPRNMASIPCVNNGLRFCLLGWYHWDADAFGRIAHVGYRSVADVAFFPFWPWLIRLGATVLGHRFPLSFLLSELLLSNLFFFAALVAFYMLASEGLHFDPAQARKALWYLTFYAYAIFFFAGYSESLFLLLTLTIFLLLQGTALWRWWLAGLLGCVAALTRSTAIVLLVPFLFFYVERFWGAGSLAAAAASGEIAQAQRWRLWLRRVLAALPALLIPAALAAYMGYLGLRFGDPFIYSRMERTVWGRQFAFPWVAFGPALGALLTGPLHTEMAVRNLMDLLFTLLPLGVLAAGWRQLPAAYRFFSLALALFALCFPLVAGETLASQPRYMMMAFPLFLVLARWSKRFPSLDLVYGGFCAPLFALNALLFTLHYWVA
ncbi:mannosyltransferase family protein [Thermogemmatispora onikobensis]|uniref:mannosyltransferase family protein n=1 Tax=Thermogemmatispora onikobensis TaxID=732234 RepID=UPI00085381F5|nr:mannosyltransferase family protein [Thermogemmatispora onikobensis]